jgi:type VI secretion system secreted protein VgrG
MKPYLVPKIWFLSLNSDCKIFQNMSVPEIVSKVLDDAGKSRTISSRHIGTYPTREYCVQYRESSLTLYLPAVGRGGDIFYFFAHQASKHTMVFADNNTTRGLPCPEGPGYGIKYSYDQDGYGWPRTRKVWVLERIEPFHR